MRLHLSHEVIPSTSPLLATFARHLYPLEAQLEDPCQFQLPTSPVTDGCSMQQVVVQQIQPRGFLPIGPAPSPGEPLHFEPAPYQPMPLPAQYQPMPLPAQYQPMPLPVPYTAEPELAPPLLLSAERLQEYSNTPQRPPLGVQIVQRPQLQLQLPQFPQFSQFSQFSRFSQFPQLKQLDVVQPRQFPHVQFLCFVLVVLTNRNPTARFIGFETKT
ncbi:MAG: hypothetical protein KVP17_002811 [Porospora cf. gigantea B]|uniref:uncharacterized protein n=1 Tax=Porospora cf. gigantea B TaxID=2853592 RepID=UPI003571C486|nr:MAG: hypothetical protein KVP17_002811 [Porospora cf. gigantea B]